jgi:N-acetylglucosamine-6-sulfatase
MSAPETAIAQESTVGEQQRNGSLLGLKARNLLAAGALLLSGAGCTASEATVPNVPGTVVEGVENPIDQAEKLPSRPNVVFILADDLQLELIKDIPYLQELIIDQGMTANNFTDANGLCCPSRAEIITALYMHNNHIESNDAPQGGFAKFYKLREEASTIATWIRNVKDDQGRSIYDTALFDKYMNGYGEASGSAPSTYVPPGWTYWAAPVAGSLYNQDHYKLNINGLIDKQFRDMSQDPENFLLKTSQDMAVKYMADHAQSGKPYFMYWAPPTPHFPSTHSAKYDHFPVDFSAHRKLPSFNEADISDKPKLLQLPPLTPSQIRQIKYNYTQRVRSLQDFGDAVKAFIDEAKADGTYDNTIFIVTSDNGYHMGEHRADSGKNMAYDTDVHEPFYVVGHGIPKGASFDEPVSNVDIAPTIAEMVGATPDYPTDGRSMVPLVEGQHPEWRLGSLLERGNSQTYSVTGEHMTEPADNPAEIGKISTVRYEGIRTDRFTYVMYQNGAREFYDNKLDPYQLNNLLSGKLNDYYSRMQTELVGAIDDMKNCKGEACQVDERKYAGTAKVSDGGVQSLNLVQ